jgi:hypothetical protein
VSPEGLYNKVVLSIPEFGAKFKYDTDSATSKRTQARLSRESKLDYIEGLKYLNYSTVWSREKWA